VAYSPRSGDVHLLNPAAYSLLDTLTREALTADELAERLATAAARAVDDELKAAVLESLTSLDEAGLVEPSQP
jgi:PqqD family protein of HPr-rel-A system